MALLFLVILAAILVASIIKGAAKLAFKVIPIVFIAGVIFIGMSHESTTPAAAVVQPDTAAPVPAITTAVEVPASSGQIKEQHVAAATTPEPSSKLETLSADWETSDDASVSRAEPGSATQWNEEDTKPAKPRKKHGKTTRRAKAEPEPDATPTIREHVDEILDAPSPKAAVRAYADWLDELNEEMDKAAAEMDDQD
jgi:hypothetical protein